MFTSTFGGANCRPPPCPVSLLDISNIYLFVLSRYTHALHICTESQMASSAMTRLAAFCLTLLAFLASAQDRCSRNEYRCKEGRCISKRFLCDGWQDCQDGADEKNCVSTCGSNEFRCPGGNTCLHESVKCNGDFDCPDGGDELQCDYPLCKADEFQCQNGWCLHQSWVCDGYEDCLLAEDEAECRQCPASMFQCSPDNCIPPSLVCNGMKDCDNGKDEKGCCDGHECGDGRCILDSQKCDKRMDCQDGSDESEATCGPPPCPDFTFQCGDRTCIEVEKVCDGVLDCRDQTDEKQPSCHQMLIMRKRMRGLYNGFDSYVGKVSTLLNYIPALQNQIETVEGQLRGVRGEIESVRREVASGGGQTVVYRDGGGGSGEVSAYIENRIVQLESSLGNVKSDLQFLKAEFTTEKNARASDSNTLEEVATTVYLQKQDVSKLGREIQTVITDVTSLKYELETLSSSFASYKQSNYGLGDKVNANSVSLETLNQKLYYQDSALQSLKQQMMYRSSKKKRAAFSNAFNETLTDE
ncbi:hypothetical protein ACHWQZ_G007550 [Mnemiopsis leidyi]